MHVDQITQRVTLQLRELTTEYSGWRFGLGGSGHWWAVRRNEFLRAPSAEELKRELSRHLAAQSNT